MSKTTIEIGGNSLSLWLGKKLTKWGETLMIKGKKTTISNPTSKLHSPYLLVINFTVNNKEKYTLTLQGLYKEKYKEFTNEDNPITIDEMLMLIVQHENKKRWFLKE